jgi:hypothetical protein
MEAVEPIMALNRLGARASLGAISLEDQRETTHDRKPGARHATSHSEWDVPHSLSACIANQVRVLSISGAAHGTGYGYGVDTQIDKILVEPSSPPPPKAKQAEKASAVARRFLTFAPSELGL